MEAFKLLDNRKLSAQIRGQIQTADKQLWTFWNLVFNCINRAFECNDVTHANRALEMARAVGRFKVAKSIMVQVVPFAYTTEEQFHGKQKKGMHNKLADTYEEVLRSLIAEQQDADSKPKQAREFELETALESLYKRANKAGFSNDDILAAVIDHNKLSVAA